MSCGEYGMIGAKSRTCICFDHVLYPIPLKDDTPMKIKFSEDTARRHSHIATLECEKP